jgi:hypothetical protein
LPDEQMGPSGAYRGRALRVLGLAMLATSLAVGGLAFGPQPAEAAQKKVVIVVGPVGSNTASFKRTADQAAAAARAQGAKVIKIYSPNATWARVKQAARGAHVFVYLGHGNGWPSPYKPFQTRTKNGLGLNSKAGRGNSNHKYYGERLMASELNLAKNAVVLLLRLCYASGNSEPGKANPSKSVAMQRVDHYAAGFLRGGASVVLAEGMGHSKYVFQGLFRSNKTMSEIFWSAPSATRKHRINFNAKRSTGHVVMDPRKPSAFYRSIVGKLDFKASDWR